MQVILQNGGKPVTSVCLFGTQLGWKKLHNLVIRRDLLLIYIVECKFKKKNCAGIDVLAEYNIQYSNEKILNCFPNSYIKPWEFVCFFLIVLLFFSVLTQMRNIWLVFCLFFLHKDHDFAQIGQSIWHKLATFSASFCPEVPHTSATLIGINDNAYFISFFLFLFSPSPLPHIYFPVWLIQPWDARGITGSQWGRPWSFLAWLRMGQPFLHHYSSALSDL